VDVAVAAELATEIDRLALCIHRPTGRRPDLMAALVTVGMPRQSIVVLAARFLAAGELSFADLASMSRYITEEDTRKLLRAHPTRGLLEPVVDEDEVFRPSEPLRAGARLVLDLQGEEAERLWSSASSLETLVDLARAHVDAALDSELPLDAFRRQTRVHHTVPPSDAGQLLGCITALRYLRSDVHAACLAEEGLSGPGARTMHRVWRGFAVAEDIDRALVDATCERVEAATNEGFAGVFAPLDAERSSELLDRMRTLPGEDPRPAEDR
jgi:hypothetical protein